MNRVYAYVLIVICAGCSASSNQGASTSAPALTTMPPQQYQAGTLSVIINKASTSAIHEFSLSTGNTNTLAGTITLNGSSGVTSLTVTLTLNPVQNPPLGIISPSSCVLSSQNNSCTFEILGLQPTSLISVTASADGYPTAHSPTVQAGTGAPNVVIGGGSSLGRLSISMSPTIAVGFSKTATVSLFGSNNLSNVVVSFASSNPAIAAVASPSCTILPSIGNTCTVSVNALSVGEVNISAFASPSTPVIAPLTVSQFWTQISNGGGQPTTTTRSQVNLNATPTFTLATDNSKPANIWDFANGTWTQLNAAVPPGVIEIFGNPTPTSIAIWDASVHNNLWIYNGAAWQQFTTGIGPPTEPANIDGGIVGNPTPSSVVAQDAPLNLWAYNGTVWKELTNGTGSPTQPDAPTWSISNNATASFILIADSHGYLWEYNAGGGGTGWTQLTNGVSTPSNAQSGIFGPSTPSSIVIQDRTDVVWTSTNNGASWTQQTGGASQPVSAGSIILGNPTASSIVLISNQLWAFNGTSWTQLTGGAGQPATLGLIARNPTPSSILITDANNNVWIYNGTSWTQLSGNGSTFSPNPGDGNFGFFAGIPTPTAIVIADSNFNIWSFDGTTWTQLTGVGSSLPDPKPASNVNITISRAATPSAIVERDASGNLWVGQN